MRPRANDTRARLGPATGAVCLTIAAIQVGCTARVLVPSATDPLRERISELENENRLLRQQAAELQQAMARERSPSARSLAPEVLANLPLPVRLAASFGSAVRTSDSVDAPIELAVHATATDSRDRFVQLTGWVDVTIVTFTPNPAEALVLATRRFEPGEVRDALRSGFFGLHYAFPVTLPAEAVRDRPSVVARVLYRDGFTEQQLESVVQCPLRR